MSRSMKQMVQGQLQNAPTPGRTKCTRSLRSDFIPPRRHGFTFLKQNQLASKLRWYLFCLQEKNNLYFYP